MPRKVHNHDRKSAYRNDVQRKEWMGGLGYICYNKRCQAGYVLVPTLFSIFLPAILEQVFRDMRDGVYIQSPQNADIFTKYYCERTAFFADDSALIAQKILFVTASSEFGPKINIKTGVMFQPNSTTTMEEDINVDDTTLNHLH